MTSPAQIAIGDRLIGDAHPTYVIAEMSANHDQGFDTAADIIRAAKDAGADAVKLQTYTAETMTIDADEGWFKVSGGTPWDGSTLYELYERAAMPWDWQPKLMELASSIGIELFSSAFDDASVHFLEGIDAPAYKIASFEIVDLPLIRRVAETGKPIIISTGMATEDEISEALDAARSSGADEVALLHCVSAYPAPPASMHLRTIPDLKERFGVPVGLSDHTLGIGVAVAAVSLGASILEKHLTLGRDTGGPDATFSVEPREFRGMVEAVRQAEVALGPPRYGPKEAEGSSHRFRRSIFVVRDVAAGDVLTHENLRVIRPGDGLAPRFLDDVIGKRAVRAISRGTPLAWEMLSVTEDERS